jgi:hypothetical protein
MSQRRKKNTFIVHCDIGALASLREHIQSGYIFAES